MDRRQFALGAIALALGASPAFGKEKYDAWKGSWSGKWGGVLKSGLSVSRVSDDGKASGRYSWGRHPSGAFGAGSTSWSGKISGKTLSFGLSNGARLKFTMSGNRLSATYVFRGETSRGVFTKG